MKKTKQNLIICIICVVLFIGEINGRFLQQEKIQEVEFDQEQINKSLWEQFKIEFEKNYNNLNDELQRFEIFKQNLQIIEQLKQDQEDGATYGITKFMDISPKEFSIQYLLSSKTPTQFSEDKYKLKHIPQNINNDLPTNFNWVDHGAVTSVKDQGSVGTCWAFSTCGNVEGQWKLAGEQLVSLSEEQLVDCAATTNPPDALCGVFGGWPYLAYEYIINVGGIASNESYPYCVGIGGKNACYPCTAPLYNETLCGPGLYPPSCNDTKWPCKQDTVQYTAHLKSWSAVSQNETIIQQTLYEVGPLSVCLNAANLQFYKSGVYSPKKCNPKNLDHAVLLTGYGVTDSTDEKSPNTPYWIVKNSWGTKWGINGYFWILRGTGECGINTEVTTSVVDVTAKNFIQKTKIISFN